MSTDPFTAGLQVFVVGGAVRDALLGQPHGDRDWVVVGSTPQEMVARGFIPVGADFPVFLHPRTKDEYALARTERKSGRGYKGFTFYTGPDVTLEADLQRRDLTVNAIAQNASGALIDPEGGVRDIDARVLRHVGPAFEEDPVRILRLARFSARFTDFRIAPETLLLCQRMVSQGEVDALVAERVWQELSRGLMCAKPSRMLAVLADTGALTRVMPELVDTARVRAAVDVAASCGLALASRYALLCVDSVNVAVQAKRLRVSTECADMARLLPNILAAVPRTRDAEHIMHTIESCDGIRKPDRFVALLQAAQVLVDVNVAVWRGLLDAVLAVDGGAVAKQATSAAEIKSAVRAARLQALVAGL